MKYPHRQPFTLLEMLVATGVTVLLFGSVIPFMLGMIKSACVSSVRADVRNQVNTARGWLTEDVEGTSQSQILTVADSGGSTIAFAVPLYRRSSSTAVPLLSDNATIAWTDVAVYYLYRNPQGVTQLCRTMLAYSYYSGLTTAQQQALLNSLVTTGTPLAAGVAAANIRYFRVLLKQVDSFRVQFSTTSTDIDGYAAAVSRATVPLGTVILTPGTHRLKYLTSGKNSAASGYGIGVDSFIASPAGLPQEAEHYLPVAASAGATAAAQNMMQLPNWRNNAVLNFPASGASQYFAVDFYYDTWWESLFNDNGASFDKAQTAVLSADGDQVVQMVGNFTSWSADNQTAGSGTPAALNLHRTNVRALLATPVNPAGGKGIKISFKAADSQALNLVSACIMAQANGFDGTAGTVQNLLFSGVAAVTIPAGSEVTSDALSLALDPTKNYLVSFYAKSASGTTGATQRSTGASLTATIANTDTNLAATPTWTGQAVTPLPQMIGVTKLVVLYPDTATYTSQIANTRIPTAPLGALFWHGERPALTGLTLKVRAGNQADLADASAWSALPSHSALATQESLAGLYGQYVQFQAAFTAQAPYSATASLRDVKITWPGNQQLVQFSADLAKGPDRGKFQFFVDDVAPRPAWVRLNFACSQNYLGTKYGGTLDVQLQPRNN